MSGDPKRPIGILKVDIVWKKRATVIQKEYYHPLEIPKIKLQLQRQGIELLKRWALEDGELTLDQAKKWPQRTLHIKSEDPSVIAKFKRWLKGFGL